MKETLDVWIVILKHHFGAIAVGFSGEIGEEIIDEGKTYDIHVILNMYSVF